MAYPIIRSILRLAILVAVPLAIVAAAVSVMEDRFIYFPWRELVAQPSDVGLESDEVWLRAGDGVRLHGWWLPGKTRTVMIWYHGNAGNISHRLDNARLLIDRFGLDILLVDYRGYGRSDGDPNEKGIYLDARAMYAEARRRGFPPERIVLFGRSLGAAVAVEIALEHPAGALILETPFRSIPALARELYRVLPGFLFRALRTRFDTEDRIGRISIPTLLITAERDEIVPGSHGGALFEKLVAKQRRFYVIPGATHNDTYVVGGEAYFKVWKEFLEEAGIPLAD